MILLEKNNQTVYFDILGYEFKEYTPLEDDYDYDAQWLIIKLIFEGNIQKEFIGPYIMTFELIELITSLSRLYNNMTNKIQTKFEEPYFSIIATKVENKINFEIKMIDFETNKKYQIKKDITLDELENIISNLEVLSLKYPERA